MIGLAAVILLGALITFIHQSSDVFRVERSAFIHAPVEHVFGYINNLRQWQLWSPFEKLDPNMTKTFTGPDAGPGASFAWSGNRKAGEGKLTITDSKPSEYVAMTLEFTRPFAATNQVRFTLTPTAGGTNVTWQMLGKPIFITKIFQLLMDMECMVGKEFAEGLANLDRVAREPAKV